MKKIYLLATFLMLLSVSVNAQTKRYVKVGGAGDGSSWNSASANLQGMINASTANDEVWVAAGTYLPTEKIDANGGARDVSFILKAGVKIYGGLADGATDLTSRNFITNASILSGDLNSSGGANSGDAHHVVVSTGNSNNAVLDGFTIQYGCADLATELTGIARNQGAGINITNEETSITFRNLIIRGNQSSVNQGTTLVNGGAGVYLKLSGNLSTCTLENVTFDTNIATASGGALYFASASGNPKVTVLNSKVFSSSGTSGAGFYVLGTSGNVPQFNVLNTIFSENRASNNPGGGAIYVGGFTNSNVVNCTFYNNSNANGALSFNNAANTVLNLYNNIFNGNTRSISNLTSADIRNITGATLDLRFNLFQVTPIEDTDPEYKNIVQENPTNLFLSTAIANANFLKLVEGAATQKGNNQYAADFGLTKDLGGEERVKYDIVDLGAYEYQGTLPVILESFSASKNTSNVKLQWKVAAEINNDRFIVERGSDFASLQKLTTIASKGDTRNSVIYNYTDYSPINGNNYYRLSQIDKDGTLKIMATEVVKFNFSKIDVIAYPNPSKDFIKLKVNNFKGLVNVKLVSLLGQTVLSKRFDPANEILLDVRNIDVGSYILLIENGKESCTFKTTILR